MNNTDKKMEIIAKDMNTEPNKNQFVAIGKNAFCTRPDEDVSEWNTKEVVSISEKSVENRIQQILIKKTEQYIEAEKNNLILNEINKRFSKEKSPNTYTRYDTSKKYSSDFDINKVIPEIFHQDYEFIDYLFSLCNKSEKKLSKKELKLVYKDIADIMDAVLFNN